MKSLADKKVALVHDWLYGGGGERIVLELHKLFPDAPIYSSYCTDEWREKLDNRVVTGYLQHWPFSKLRKFLPLFRQRWFSRLDLSDYDIVISTTGNGEAKFVKVPGGKHISYCFTPVHFYWRHYDAYLKEPGFRPKWLARLGLKLLLKPLRQRDYTAAQSVDHFVGISSHIQSDIKTYYDRESTLIHPPVNIEAFSHAKTTRRNGFITVGRLVPNKRVDIIVRACTELSLPLKVVGKGPNLSQLQKISGPTVEFVTDADDQTVANYLANAEAFLFASFEDFGIAPVEAMAAGTPVIAYHAGGALDYVLPGKTGEFFDEQTVDSLGAVLKSFNGDNYHAGTIRNQANSFSVDKFQKRVTELLESLY